MMSVFGLKSRSYFGIFFVLGLPVAGCKERLFNADDSSSTATGGPLCSSPVEVSKLVQPHTSCSTESLEDKRKMYEWIPCNKVMFVSEAVDGNDMNQRIMNFVAERPRPDEASLKAILEHPETVPPSSIHNPILEKKISKEVISLIRSAKETIFFDVFLFGGSWGTEIARELILASKRGVQVVMLRDPENSVLGKPEMQPLWNALNTGLDPRLPFVLLRSEIHAKEPSGYPFGLNQALFPLQKYAERSHEIPVSLDGKSDHSKVIVVDGFSSTPRMYLGSRNMTDSLASYHLDEVFFIEGPAAGAAFLLYLQDIEQALLLELRSGGIPEAKYNLVQNWIIRLKEKRTKGMRVPPAGKTPVKLLENNATDSVRNIEHTVLNMLVNATRSVDMYSLISYNPALSRVLADNVRKGKSVRLINDFVVMTQRLNSSFPVMLSDAGLSESQIERMLRWRIPLQDIEFPNNPARIPLRQQQHVKTIIVDNEFVLAGTANFDFATFAGAFREMSAIVHSPEIAAQASQTFSQIYNDNTQTRSMSEQREAFPNVLKNPIFGRAIATMISAETMRIHAMNPERMTAGQCR